jgi:hypothetical protein
MIIKNILKRKHDEIQFIKRDKRWEIVARKQIMKIQMLNYL